MWARWILLCGVVLAIPSCGGGVCGEGTVRHKDSCLPFDPFDKTAPIVTVDPPVRTRNVGNVRLISNESAEIFVTLDDTPVTAESQHEPDQLVIPNDSNDIVLRYFAIDLAGNQSLEQTVVWKIDLQGPAPPGRFKLTRSGDQRDLSWLPPQNEPRLGGVLVARVEGRVTVQPTSGVEYAIGDEIEPGVTVVEVDGPEIDPATFTETQTTKPGLVRYAAWAFDDLLNYGPPTGDFSLVSLGTQTGSVVIDTITGNVTQSAKPSGIVLSGTATPAAAGNVTAKLTIRNETTRVLFAPKLVVKNGVTFNQDGLFETFPYKAYGAAINPGATVSVSWTFSGVSGNSLLVQLEIRDNPILMSSMQSRGFGGSVDDIATGIEVKQLAAGPGDARGGFGILSGGFTPDGQAVFGSRSSGTISRWDLQSGNRVQTTELRAQDSHIPQVVLDRSGSIGYALVSESHVRKLRSSGGVDTELVRFDVATLTDQGRVSIGSSRNRDMRITSDGRFLIIASGTARGVLVVDTETFSVVRTLVTGSRVETVALSADETQLAAVGSDVQIFSLSDGTKLKTLALGPTGGRVFRASFNGANELWVARQNQLEKIDLTEVAAPQVFPGRTRGVDVVQGKIYTDTSERDTDGNIVIPFNFSSRRGHWLGRSPF